MPSLLQCALHPAATHDLRASSQNHDLRSLSECEHPLHNLRCIQPSAIILWPVDRQLPLKAEPRLPQLGGHHRLRNQTHAFLQFGLFPRQSHIARLVHLYWRIRREVDLHNDRPKLWAKCAEVLEEVDGLVREAFMVEEPVATRYAA